MRHEEKEALKEELRAYTELFKVFSASVIALGSGLVTLFLNLNSKEKLILFELHCLHINPLLAILLICSEL